MQKGFKSDSDTGRGERIRTSGLYVPNVALHQAELHPDTDSRPCGGEARIVQKHFGDEKHRADKIP